MASREAFTVFPTASDRPFLRWVSEDEGPLPLWIDLKNTVANWTACCDISNRKDASAGRLARR